jgi:DinB superfamily
LPIRTLLPDQFCPRLATTPGLIAELTAGLPPDAVDASPSPGAWSLNSILAHLRACADVWGANIEEILTEDAPTIHAINPRVWSEATISHNLTLEISLETSTRRPAALLTRLLTLTAATWKRSAAFNGAGAPAPRTVQFVAARMLNHEGSHLKRMNCVVTRSRAWRFSSVWFSRPIQCVPVDSCPVVSP